MFGQSRRARQRAEPSDGEAGQPLLDLSQGHSVSDDQVVFAIDDDDDVDEHPEQDILGEGKGGHSVRFQEDVQVIGPPLRSTIQSRETQYELDSDELDEAEVDGRETPPRNGHDGGQTMPLLVGLMDSATSRRLADGSSAVVSEGGTAHDDNFDLEELAKKGSSGGSLLDSIANMANSILGAGIIGLPYAVRQAGFFTGIALLVVLCGVTDWTIRLIVINAKLSGTHSYIDIMHKCFGPSGRAAVSFFQFAFAFGGMCAFGIIIGDTIPQVIRSIFPTLQNIPVLSLFTRRQFIIALCTLCVSYPLSLYRDIHKLSRASGLALIGMLIIVSSVLIEGPQVPPELKGDPSKRFTVLQPSIFQAIGVISFAYVCHHNSLLIYGSLRTPTLDRFSLVTHISTFMSLIACCSLAISAYLVFTDKTQGNILNNFSRSDKLINVARFCFGLNMFTTLPLELFVCREVIEQYFFANEPFNQQRHIFFTTVLIVASMLVALVTCDLGVMLEITGGISATALAFIFPPACYLKLIDRGPPWYSRTKLPATACVTFGILVMCISLFLTLQKVWTPEGNAKICI